MSKIYFFKKLRTSFSLSPWLSIANRVLNRNATTFLQLIYNINRLRICLSSNSLALICLFSLLFAIFPSAVNSQQNHWDQQTSCFKSWIRSCKQEECRTAKFYTMMTCWDSHSPVVICEAAQGWPNYSPKTIRHHPKACHHSLHLDAQLMFCIFLIDFYPLIIWKFCSRCWPRKLSLLLLVLIPTLSSHLSMQMREPM